MKTKELEERILKLENALKISNETVSSENSYAKIDTKETKDKKDKVKRAPSAYNIYMKEEIAKLKKEQGDNFDVKVAFKTISKSWSDSKASKGEKNDGWFG